MTVYHGGILEIRNPDVTHSKKYLDYKYLAEDLIENEPELFAE